MQRATRRKLWAGLKKGRIKMGWRQISYLGLFFSLFSLLSMNLQAAENLRQPSQQEVNELVEEVFDRWLDGNGFMRLTPQGKNASHDNENPVLFTSEFVFLLDRLGYLRGDLRNKLKRHVEKSINAIRIRRRDNGQIVYGLFNRRPQDFYRHFSRDEQIGLLVLDHAFDFELGYARELYAYGSSHDWRFENRTFEGRKAYRTDDKPASILEVFFDSQRRPDFIGLVTVCARRQAPSWLPRALNMSLNLTRKEEKQETSRKILAVLRLELLRGKSAAIDRLRNTFYQKLQEQYGQKNFLLPMFRIYFEHKDHPLPRLAEFLQWSE